MKKNLNLIAIVFIVLTFIAACNNSGSGINSVTNTVNLNGSGNGNKTIDNSNAAVAMNQTNKSVEVAGPPSDTKLNVENFNKLETGMKYSEVVKILGSKGELIGEYEFSGNKTTMYKWSGENGAFLKVVFQNEKLLDKAHTLLK